ncbi:hypothetical protein ACRAWF_34420 [Streptomyces sp. L7]
MGEGTGTGWRKRTVRSGVDEALVDAVDAVDALDAFDAGPVAVWSDEPFPFTRTAQLPRPLRLRLPRRSVRYGGEGGCGW